MRLPRVVSLTEYRVVKEYMKLLSAYTEFLNRIPGQDFNAEIIKWQEEQRKHPNHYLVLVKGKKLFESYLKRIIPPEKRDRAERILSHVEATLEDRLEYKEQEIVTSVPDRPDNEPDTAS